MEVLLVSAALLLLASCGGKPGASHPADSDAVVTDAVQESIAPSSEPTPQPTPTESEVLEMRERVLRGMSEDEIHTLTNLIKQSNYW